MNADVTPCVNKQLAVNMFAIAALKGNISVLWPK